VKLGKVLVMLCAPLLGINVALRPLQLLWLNLLTDRAHGARLGVEPAEAGRYEPSPRRPGSPVLDKPVRLQDRLGGWLIGVLALGIGAVLLRP